jgi:uncharacterized ion transporter superfamily protein YfcC
METKAGAHISKKAFFQSIIILLVIMILAGVLTKVIPAGRFDRIIQGERELIQPDSFSFVEAPNYPVWRWFTAPIEVLWGEDSLLVIVISLFILMVGGAFAVMETSGILQTGLERIVNRYQDRKYLLLMLITLFFMMLGAFFGIFEEVVPLVPIILALSYYLGWDALVGLGMSILATNMGFSAAITNPFTIGVAQELAGLPLFSGSWFRVPFFIIIYSVLVYFLIRYARRIEKTPERSLVFEIDQEMRTKRAELKLDLNRTQSLKHRRAMTWFGAFLLSIISVLLGAPFSEFLSDYALPLVGFLFLFGGVGAGLLTGIGSDRVWKALREGFSGIAPGVILILMAVSVKVIVQNGQIMDTILYRMSGLFDEASPFLSAVLIFILALIIEFFISSGSAKAFLLMPILLPLADLVGITRQIAVTAYCFGDGFSNMFYPTSAVLLISLGLTPVSLPKWLRWTAPLWMIVLTIAILFLGVAVAVGYGPF